MKLYEGVYLYQIAPLVLSDELAKLPAWVSSAIVLVGEETTVFLPSVIVCNEQEMIRRHYEDAVRIAGFMGPDGRRGIFADAKDMARRWPAAQAQIENMERNVLKIHEIALAEES